MQLKVQEIIKKYFAGDYSEKVQNGFLNWFKNGENTIEKENALKDVWDNIEVEADNSTQESYSALASIINENNKPKRPQTSLFKKILRVAAVMMLPLISTGITYFVMKNHQKQSEGIQLVEHIVPHGEIKTITLPDSSAVTINSGSIVIYPYKFSGQRDIFLNGEAYFDVVRDDSKPFVVKTADLHVQALGTSFNVSSYLDSDNASVTLESGKLLVEFRNQANEAVIIQPGEQIAYYRPTGNYEKRNVDVNRVTAWIEGSVIIQSLTFSELAKVIERRYAIQVYYNSSKFANDRITLTTAEGETVNELMNILQYLIPGLEYRIENDKLYIY